MKSQLCKNQKDKVYFHTKIILIVALISNYFGFAQSYDSPPESTKISHFFTQFEFSVPIKGNPNRNEDYVDGVENTNKSWFVPDGLSAKIGYGIQQNRWVGLSLHTGIDWKATEKLVSVPVYANFRLSPALSSESRVTLQVGYGKGFALGRGNLSGEYRKISLGIESDEDILLFIEVADYKIKVREFNSVGSISLGLALRTF